MRSRRPFPAEVVSLPTFTDARGSLSVLEKALPFAARRLYFIHGVPKGAVRGGHRHLKNRQVLVCLAGSCEVVLRRGDAERTVLLEAPDQCLPLEPEDWHLLKGFSEDAVVLVAASRPYDPEDEVREVAP